MTSLDQLDPVDLAPVPFIDLAAQQRRLSGQIDTAIATVLAHGQYVLGPEVAELEGRPGRTRRRAARGQLRERHRRPAGWR